MVLCYPFLGNGSVNTFPRQWLRMQKVKLGVVYAIHAQKLQRRCCEEMTLAYEAEESPLLEAVSREWLVTTADWKRFSGCHDDL
jgi:type II secretory ATPase GspE/PulE/Tfp pilus assembly ATPase PilB-like protein